MNHTLNLMLALYELGLLAYLITGWIRHPAAARFRRMIGRGYEPLLVPIRNHVPQPRFGASVIDVSPPLLLMGLVLVRGLIGALAGVVL